MKDVNYNLFFDVMNDYGLIQKIQEVMIYKIDIMKT